MAPRLTSRILVDGLIRAVEAKGGSATVLRLGDRSAGDLLLVTLSRGVPIAIYEHAGGAEGGSNWRKIEQDESLSNERVARLIDTRARFDPDLWVVEADIPESERFIAECLNR